MREDMMTLRLRRADDLVKSRRVYLKRARRDLAEAERVVADWEKAVADAINDRDFIQAQIDHEKDSASA